MREMKLSIESITDSTDRDLNLLPLTGYKRIPKKIFILKFDLMTREITKQLSKTAIVKILISYMYHSGSSVCQLNRKTAKLCNIFQQNYLKNFYMTD